MNWLLAGRNSASNLNNRSHIDFEKPKARLDSLWPGFATILITIIPLGLILKAGEFTPEG